MLFISIKFRIIAFCLSLLDHLFYKKYFRLLWSLYTYQKLEKEIKTTIETEFKKLSASEKRKIDRKKELEERLVASLREGERLEAIFDKIMRDRIVKEFCIEELNKEMLNEAKLLEETEAKLFGIAYRIMNAIHWGYQEELILLEEKLDTQKLECESRIK